MSLNVERWASGPRLGLSDSSESDWRLVCTWCGLRALMMFGCLGVWVFGCLCGWAFGCSDEWILGSWMEDSCAAQTVGAAGPSGVFAMVNGTVIVDGHVSL